MITTHEEWIIVKVQVSLDGGVILIYNEDRSVFDEWSADEEPELLKLMAGRKKAFFWGVLRMTAPGRRDLEIGPDRERGEPPWQDW